MRTMERRTGRDAVRLGEVGMMEMGGKRGLADLGAALYAFGLVHWFVQSILHFIQHEHGTSVVWLSMTDSYSLLCGCDGNGKEVCYLSQHEYGVASLGLGGQNKAYSVD